MGFPVSSSMQQACGGVACQFSDGVVGPTQRAVKSMRNQSGNTIHLNHVGGLTLLVAGSWLLAAGC